MSDKIWGIHMPDWVGEQALTKGFVAIGWSKVGDLDKVGGSRDDFKERLLEAYPERKKGAIPGDAGILYRFSTEMQIGDYVLFPSKHDRHVNIGIIESLYFYENSLTDSDGNAYPNRRKVKWLGHFPRSDFSQSALYEIGSIITLFAIKNHAAEFLSKIGKEDINVGSEIVEDDDTATRDVAGRAEKSAQDFIIKGLHSLVSGHEFESFVAHLLECMGYTARVTEASADGGVDIVAHNDRLGLEPPIIKVQCKRTENQIEEKQVRDLAGTLGDGEYGLFVTLGGYSKPARVFERNKPKLRLIEGEQLVEIILENYSKLSPRYRTMLPLKQIYIPDLPGS